jgi:hypothetical protein
MHLNLSGMKLKERVLQIVPQLCQSKTLVAVHLGDNEISSEVNISIKEAFGINFVLKKENPSDMVDEIKSEKFKIIK